MCACVCVCVCGGCKVYGVCAVCVCVQCVVCEMSEVSDALLTGGCEEGESEEEVEATPETGVVCRSSPPKAIPNSLN